MNQSISTVQPGIYKHWKGKFYRVLMTATSEATRELCVVYVPLYGDGRPTIRTVRDFTEQLNRDGYNGPRFWRQSE